MSSCQWLRILKDSGNSRSSENPKFEEQKKCGLLYLDYCSLPVVVVLAVEVVDKSHPQLSNSFSYPLVLDTVVQLGHFIVKQVVTIVLQQDVPSNGPQFRELVVVVGSVEVEVVEVTGRSAELARNIIFNFFRSLKNF